ncbi:MAG: hypothetical protein K2Y22_03765 [Candidatus Obscuribacterales bacterium]|nr:hypothetical protein [Candidatus Obscuribacterales bacterium]
MSKDGTGKDKPLSSFDALKRDGGSEPSQKSVHDKLVRETSAIPEKPSFETKQEKAAQRDSSSSSSSEKSQQKESSSSGDTKASNQAPEKAGDAGKTQAPEKPSRPVEQQTQQSESKTRSSESTGKQSEHIGVSQPESKAGKDTSAGGQSGGGDNPTGRGGAQKGGDGEAAPREKGPAVTAPESRGDAGSGRGGDPKGSSDGPKTSDVRAADPKSSDAQPKSSDVTRSPEARTSDGAKAPESVRGSDTTRDGGSRQESPKDVPSRGEAKSSDSAKEQPAGRAADQIVKSADVAQDRSPRQIEKDPIAAGKPTDAQGGKQLEQKIDKGIDAILLDSKQVGVGGRGDKIDPKDVRGDVRGDVRSDVGHKVPDARLDAGQKVPEVRGDAGSRMGGGGGAESRMDAGRRPGEGREGERLGIIGGDKGVAAGRLDVHISGDAVKLHLPEKGGQEIVLTDKNTQRSMNDAFGLFDKNEFKQIATNFKQHVDLWTELTSKQFNGLKETISNVLDAPKAAAMKELSAWAQDLSKRPEVQPDVRQELGHAVKMQLLDNLKRNDDIDRRHADLKERCVNLLDEFKQIKTDLLGRAEEAVKIARSFFTAPIERTPVVHIAQDSPSKKLTEAEIDELLNVRLREFTPAKSKDEDSDKNKGESDKKDEQKAAVQQAMQQASHTVKKGETIAMIAAKYCGSEECAVLIAEMNRGVITATYEKGSLVFHAPEGAVLNIPYDRDIREFKERVLGLAGNIPDGNQF